MQQAEDDPQRAQEVHQLRGRLLASGPGMVLNPPPYSHYVSTACQHQLCDGCRLTCKFCLAPCCCQCHEPTAAQMIQDGMHERDAAQ